MKNHLSIGEGNSKSIAVKYRYLDPSMVGVLDLNVSSNSDIGMSGSFVPFVKLYDGYFFTPEHQPCKNRYLFEKALEAEGLRTFPVSIGTFEDYVKMLENGDKFKELLKPEKIIIIEKTPDEIRQRRESKNSSISHLVNDTEESTEEDSDDKSVEKEESTDA